MRMRPAATRSSESALERLRAALAAGEGAGHPRHTRLRSAMLDLMAEGHWAPGDKLPPERTIAEAVGLSLGTVQKTLGHLAASNVLVRRHGHGTFVSAGSQASQLLHFRFVGDGGEALAPVFAEALDRKEVKAKGPWSDFLVGAKTFIRVRRRIRVADEFDCVSAFYIDAARFAKVLTMPFEELNRVRIRTVLAEHFNAPTLSITQHAYATQFPAEIGALIRAPKKAAFGMVLEVHSFTHRQAPVSLQQIFIPAGVRHLEVPSPHLPPR